MPDSSLQNPKDSRIVPHLLVQTILYSSIICGWLHHVRPASGSYIVRVWQQLAAKDWLAGQRKGWAAIAKLVQTLMQSGT